MGNYPEHLLEVIANEQDPEIDIYKHNDELLEDFAKDMENSRKKPLIGCIPEWLVEVNRIRDLTNTLRYHIDQSDLTIQNIDRMSDWTHEILRRLDNIKTIKKNSNQTKEK